MSNANTGFWSALGAVVGGVAGAAAGHYAEQMRPRARYAHAPRTRTKSDVMEDAMVVGGAVGAVSGAFLFGTIAGNEPPQLPPR